MNIRLNRWLLQARNIRMRARQSLTATQAKLRRRVALSAYYRANRRPWSFGYYTYRTEYFQTAFNDPELLRTLEAGKPLPANYGFRLDSRVVEIPWVLARLVGKSLRLLDAGSSLNSAVVLDCAAMRTQTLTVMTLGPEADAFWQRGISYVYGDLRDTNFRDECFDAVACISTIEHIGMDNSRYALDMDGAKRGKSDDFLRAIREFKRVLKPDGVLYITLPFGRYEDHGWLQQFDAPLLDQLIEGFSPRYCVESLYRYLPEGWVTSSRSDAADCETFDVHTSKFFQPDSLIDYPADYAAGERAIACLELHK